MNLREIFSGYTVATENAQAWYEKEPCIMRSKGVTTITYTIVGTTPTTTTAVTYSVPLVHAMPVGIAWQSSDIVSASTATYSLPTTITSSPTTSPDSDEDASGLSTGAKAGIGAGISVGAIAIIVAVIAFLWFRRRANKGNQDNIPRSHTDDQSTLRRSSPQDHAELSGISMSPWAIELQGDRPKSRGFS